MRLVVATPLYPPEPGGPATYATLLEEELPKQGVVVDIVKFSDVRHLPRLIRHGVYAWRVKEALRHADAVLALDPVSVGLPAWYAAWVLHKPLFVKVVGDYAWEQGCQRFGIRATLDEFIGMRTVPFPVRVLRFIQTHVARAATRIIVPSTYLKHIVCSWGIPENRLSVIPNAVHLEPLGTVPEDVARLPHPRVVSVGRLVPWKGMDGIIDAVHTARSERGTVSLVLVGDGPERVPLRTRAEHMLKREWSMPGTLSHKDTLAVMKRADVFVLNSTYEGLSHLLLEACALGLPIIATDAGGNSEIITDGIDGILVAPNDTESLTHALNRILSDPWLSAKLSGEARKRAETFSVSRTIAATGSLLTTP